MQTSTASLLLVEDDQNLGSTLKTVLSSQSYQVTWAKTFKEGFEAFIENSPRLVILDVNLPDGNGFDLAEELLRQDPNVTFLFLTASDSSETRIKGLEMGAADFIPKPFHLKELLLRIQNILKRTEESLPEGVTIGQAIAFFARRQLEIKGKTVTLSPKEMAVLKLLFRKRGEVVSRDEILNVAWGQDEYPTPRTIDNFVLKLRRYVERQAEKPEVIENIRGIGYLLKP